MCVWMYVHMHVVMDLALHALQDRPGRVILYLNLFMYMYVRMYVCMCVDVHMYVFMDLACHEL